MIYSTLLFNNIPVNFKFLPCPSPRPVILNTWILEKPRKELVLLKSSTFFPGKHCLSYTCFIGPGHQPNNASFINHLLQIQFTVALGITGAIKGVSHLKVYDELALESLKCCIKLKLLISLPNCINKYTPKCIFIRE